MKTLSSRQYPYPAVTRKYPWELWFNGQEHVIPRQEWFGDRGAINIRSLFYGIQNRFLGREGMRISVSVYSNTVRVRCCPADTARVTRPDCKWKRLGEMLDQECGEKKEIPE